MGKLTPKSMLFPLINNSVIVLRVFSFFLNLFNPTQLSEGNTCCLHFTDEDTEAQMVRWHPKWNPKWKSKEPDSQVCTLNLTGTPSFCILERGGHLLRPRVRQY